MRRLISWRYYAQAIIFLLGFVIIGSRVIYLGITKNNFKHYIDSARYRNCVLKSIRGNIIDRNGVLLATDIWVYDVGVDLTKINQESNDTFAKLANLLELNIKDIESIWHPSTKQWKLIKKDVQDSVYKKIEKLKICGIYGNFHYKRVYLNTPSLSYIVGVINMEGAPIGGIERIMNFYLKGHDGYKKYEVNGKAQQIPSLNDVYIKPINGYTVELTIDNKIQKAIEDIANEFYKKFSPKSIQIIATKPSTGEVISLVELPFFDQKSYNKCDLEELKCKSFSNVYEPGSVFKTITVSSAIDCGAINLTEKFDCSISKIKYKGNILSLPHDWKFFDQKMNAEETLKNSSNRATAQIAMKMGEETFYKYVKRFGFGSSTNSGFPGETNGMLSDVKNWDKLTITRLPMGHAIACSLLQIHYAVSAIANDGNLMYPQFVKRLYDENGEIVQSFGPCIRRRVIKSSTSDIMRKIMILKNNNVFFIPNYEVASKTGTTMKIVNGKYSNNHGVGSYSGFFPARNPLVHVTIVIDDPNLPNLPITMINYVIISQIFKRVARILISTLKVPPINIVKNN